MFLTCICSGILFIAEVMSRFEDVEEFLEMLKSLGFECLEQKNYKMFILFELQKVKSPKLKDKVVALKPCLYKRR